MVDHLPLSIGLFVCLYFSKCVSWYLISDSQNDRNVTEDAGSAQQATTATTTDYIGEWAQKPMTTLT